MTAPTPYRIVSAPRMGTNDDVVRVLRWLVDDGQRVEPATLVLIVETTKASVEVEAESAGYLFRLVEPDTEVPVGAPVAVVSDTPSRPSLETEPSRGVGDGLKTLEPVVMLNMVRLSGSAVLQSLIVTTSWVALIRILASFGSAALAGYTIAIRIVLFALLPAWGLANAAATLVGQNLGAGKPERAEASVWQACRYNVMFFAVVGLTFVTLAGVLVSTFTNEPEVASVASRGLRIIASGFVFYAYGIVVTQSFNGAGDTWTPTIINLLGFWILAVPLAQFLARQLALGPSGVFWSIAAAFSTTAVAAALVFRRGRWKLKRV